MSPNGAPDGEIVLAGGYGHVGERIAERLAPLHPGRVVIAGRDRSRAEAAAARVGAGCRGRALDVGRGEAPEGAAVVVMCLDWPDPSFAANCLGRGIGYVDISADGRILEMIAGLDVTARRSGARGLIDVGLAPGLTNLLARLLVDRAGDARPIESLDLFVLLGAGDAHGPAAIEWTLARFDAEFDVIEAGRPRRVRAQREHRRVELPGGRRPAFGVRFDFPEQRSLARTLGVPTVSSWLVTLPPAAARAMRLAAVAGAGGLTRRPRSRAGLRGLLGRGSAGGDECGVIVRAAGAGGASLEAAVVGRDQSGLTGLLTALFAEEVIAGRVEPGVHHSDQAIDPLELLRALRAADPGLDIRLPAGYEL